MKKFIILLLAVTTIFAKKNKDFVFPENITVNENKTEVVGIYKVDLKDDEIYDKVLEYFAFLTLDDLTYSKRFARIEYSNKENNKIIGHLSIPGIKDFGASRFGDVDCLIEIKDGRYKITYSDVRVVQVPRGSVYCSGVSKLRGNRKYFLKLWNRDFAQKILDSFENLHNFLNTQIEKTDDDW